MNDYRIENGKLVATDNSGDTNLVGLSELTVRSGSFDFLTGGGTVTMHNTSQLLVDGAERGAKTSCGSATSSLDDFLLLLRNGFNSAPSDVEPMEVLKSVYAQIVIESQKPKDIDPLLPQIEVKIKWFLIF